MTRYKAGLHKKISSIFDGVPLQNQGQNHPEDDMQVADYHEEQTQEQNTPAQGQQSHVHEPVKKLYKDTTEKQHKTFTKFNNNLKARCLQFYQSLKERLLPSVPGVNPARQIALVILIPVLFIVLIFVLVRVLGSDSAAKGRTKNVSESSGAAKSSSTIDWQLPQPFSAQIRDPMKRVPSTSRWPVGSNNASSDAWLFSEGQVVLKGIVHGKDKANAIVGMQIVREGDKIGDITVVKINRSSVEFERNGQQKILKVGQSWFLSD